MEEEDCDQACQDQKRKDEASKALEEAKKNILLLLHNISLSKRVLLNFSKDSCNNGY